MVTCRNARKLLEDLEAERGAEKKRRDMAIKVGHLTWLFAATQWKRNTDFPPFFLMIPVNIK